MEAKAAEAWINPDRMGAGYSSQSYAAARDSQLQSAPVLSVSVASPVNLESPAFARNARVSLSEHCYAGDRILVRLPEGCELPSPLNMEARVRIPVSEDGFASVYLSRPEVIEQSIEDRKYRLRPCTVHVSEGKVILDDHEVPFSDDNRERPLFRVPVYIPEPVEVRFPAAAQQEDALSPVHPHVHQASGLPLAA